MNRGKPLRANPARAAERRARREARRAADGPRPEDVARAERQATGGQGARRDDEEDPDGRRLWHLHFSRLPCAMCEDTPVPADVARERRADLAYVQGHHVISKDRLISWGLRLLKWDIRNGVALCRYHHMRHEYAVRRDQRLPRRLIPAPAWAFADEIDCRWVLEDDAMYPPAA